ncbi:hypothetical protein D3C85_702160 [compost metagenome]
MLTDKAYDDFQDYCMKRYGFTDIWAIYTKIEHEFLSQYMDVEDRPKQLVIGKLAERERINRMRSQVEAMNKHYNENVEECRQMREDSDEIY